MASARNSVTCTTQKLLLDVPEVARLLNADESHINELDSQKKIAFISLFNKRLTTAYQLEQFIEQTFRQALSEF